MKIRFRRYQPGDDPAIARLNQRLGSAGVEHVVGREPPGAHEPSLEESPIIERMFVASDGDEVRGAVWLKEQLFWSAEGLVRAGWMIYPVSESLAERRFAGVPGTLLFGLLRQQPRLMALGMGGQAGPFARLLAGAGWANAVVPLWFRVLRPSRVLRRLPVARRTRPRRALADALTATGLAHLGNGILKGLRRGLDGRRPDPAQWVEAERFGSSSDELWERCRDHYALVAVRDSRALNALYPPGFPALARLHVRADGRDLGWVCARAIDAAGTRFEPYFGDLRLGILTDAFADPRDAARLLQAGVTWLAQKRVDLVISQHSHPGWQRATRSLGFWRGPSNFAFSWSPALAKLLAANDRHFHLTRSDGDGPEPLGAR